MQHLINKNQNYTLKNLLIGNPLNKKPKLNLSPIVFIRLKVKNRKQTKVHTLKALLDTGCTATLISDKFITKAKYQGNNATIWRTSAGSFKTTAKSNLQFTMPELHEQRIVTHDTHVTNAKMGYDMIIGMDLLGSLGIDILNSTHSIKWDTAEIPMRPRDCTMEDAYYIAEPESVKEATSRLTNILDAKYEKADLKQIVQEALHLSESERRQLLSFLQSHESLFDGTLGQWKGAPYNIHLKEDANPYHGKPYKIPYCHEDKVKVEVQRLCKIGVLKRVNHSEWAAPCFIIPKKDQTIRFISDFRELNKRIKRYPFPLPNIQELLLKLEGFQWATALDLNMGYYHIELTPNSKRMCTIVLPWGKYEYQKLPMGLSNSPDIFQENMSDLFRGFDYVREYIDDLLVTTNGTFEDHLEKVGSVLKKLQKAGLKVNANKSNFCQHEVEYLGYLITRNGIKPQPKKVEAIHNMASPKTRKQLRSFLGLVNYYRDIVIRRSDTSAPLTKLTSTKVPFKWTSVEEEAFHKLKMAISKETMLNYPDFTKEFEIHTDASDKQLGAVIAQDGKPIAFYSRRLTSAQEKYTVTERELLAIVETLKEFRSILLGQQIVVHTDHQNLTYKNFNTDRVMRWRLILEEYGPDLRYIQGEKNVVADALSRLHMNNNPAQLLCQMDISPSPSFNNQTHQDLFYQYQIANTLETDEQENPVDLAYIKHRQHKDPQLKRSLLDSKDYNTKIFMGQENPMK